MKFALWLALAGIAAAIPLNAQQANPAPAQAADQSDSAVLLQKIRDLEDRVIALEGQVRQLKSQPSAPAAANATPAPAMPAAAATPATPGTPPEATAQAAPPQTAPEAMPQSASPQTTAAGEGVASQPTYGGAGGSASKALNPDISVIGDFIGAAGHNPVQPTPSLQMHESEIGLQAIIDPYARGDFFLSFGEEGVNLKEGYATSPLCRQISW